jgi:haloalkane dehalogenase
MRMSRHYLTINGRQVHYRRCGKGPPLLMVHQSPRSSAEYEALMCKWGAFFTCIAPDTPGFGQSNPLAKAAPDINDYAAAVAEFVQALGVPRIAAYGFHSGGIILVTALKRHPELFTGIAVGGYAVWTAREMAIFGESYIPPFLPTLYGEHLPWLWNRILEQSWFFPWFDTRAEARLPMPHDDPARVHDIVMEMLAAGDAYRLGYGAVLRAPRDIPPVDSKTAAVLISAYDSDPLQEHIDRLGEMPAGWQAQKVATVDAHQQLSLDFLLEHCGPEQSNFAEDSDQGFCYAATDDFSGLIHWQRRGDAKTLQLPMPGRSTALLPNDGVLLDPPGHGLSDDWAGRAPTHWSAWQKVFAAVSDHPARLPATEKGSIEALYPALTPDRHGAYLNQAWNIVRARHLFAPWYEASAANAIAFDPAQLKAAQLAKEHLALLQARSAAAYAAALLERQS